VDEGEGPFLPDITRTAKLSRKKIRQVSSRKGKAIVSASQVFITMRTTFLKAPIERKAEAGLIENQQERNSHSLKDISHQLRRKQWQF